MDEERLRWYSYEFNYREKTADWFWAIGIITLSCAVIAILYDNILFAVFIALAGVILTMSAKRKPGIVEFELTTKGLLINDNLYPYTALHSFWVHNEKREVPKLFVRSEKKIVPVFVIPIETDFVDAETIREFLLNFLPEEKLHESLSHRLFEHLGF